MEQEVRFYYSTSELEKILNTLKEIPNLHSNLRIYEKTIQYNHCMQEYDFYTKDVDGRFRLRISKNDLFNKCKLSWKKRLKDTTSSKINIEEEKEVRINANDVDNFIYIIENVMHFKIVESYERYRTIFENNDIEIAVDEYPFGICLEIENKSLTKDPFDVISYWVDLIGLNINDAYRLSWDDKYEELCHEQNIDIFKEVTFDAPMPKVNNNFIIKEKIDK